MSIIKKYMMAFFLIGMVCMTATNVWGKIGFDWDPITPADWEIREDSEKGIKNAAIIFFKTISDDQNPYRIRDELTVDEPSITYSIYVRARILSEAGRDAGDVIIPIFTSKQVIDDIQGRTILPNGRILELDSSHIYEKVEVKTEGRVVRRKSFSLPGVTDDCIIEYYVKIDLPGLFQKGWYFQQNYYLFHGELQWKYFKGEHNISNKEYNQKFTPNWNLYPSNFEIDVQRFPSPERPSETHITVKDVAAFEEEPFSLPEKSMRGQINYYYGSRTGIKEFWKEENERFADKIKDFCKRNRRVKKVVATFKKLGSEEEKIRAAYDWVQENIENVDYIQNKDDKKYKDNKKADQVLSRGYGSSQDISTVFYNMIRELNISAGLGAVVDRDDKMFNPNSKLWQFDGLVVIIPSSGSYRFLAPGEKYLPYGYLPWYSEGVQTFVIGDIKKQFMVCPWSTSGFNSRQRNIELSFDSDFKLKGTSRETHSGHYGRRLRVLTSRMEKSGYLKEIQKQLERYYTDAEFEAISLDKIEETAAPVELNYDIVFSEGGQKVGSKLLIQPFKYMAETKNPFLADKRKTSILFDFASQWSDTLKIHIPEGWEVDALPSQARLKNDVGFCEVVFSVEGQFLSIQREFHLNKAYFQKRFYPSVKKLFQFREELEKNTIILKQASPS